MKYFFSHDKHIVENSVTCRRFLDSFRTSERIVVQDALLPYDIDIKNNKRPDRNFQRLFRFYVLTSVLLLVLFGGCNERKIQLIQSNSTESVSEGDTQTDSNTHSTTDSTTDSNTNTTEPESDEPISCSSENIIRITEIDVGQTVIANEEEAALMPISISPLPTGGSRLAWMGDDDAVHITTLDKNERIINNNLAIPANDFEDIYATSNGGVLLLTRDANGGGTLNCGVPENLCNIPVTPIPCYDMYMVGFDGAGEIWSTQLTSSSADTPPYSTGPTGDRYTFIWWYAHHGKLASNGVSYAAYFGSAVSSTTSTCIDIHQGDVMQVVDLDGNLVDGGFGWGCSPSGYERLIWNTNAHAYVAVCKSEAFGETGATGVLGFAPEKSVFWNIDPWYSNVSELVLANDGGYWVSVSERKDGQPERDAGLAKVQLLQFTSDFANLRQVIGDGDSLNYRSPHLAAYTNNRILIFYETSAFPGELQFADDRAMYMEIRSGADGTLLYDPYPISNVSGNRYHTIRSFPDGSVVYPLKGDTPTTIKILRVLPCAE